jgi:hypothetical protein
MSKQSLQHCLGSQTIVRHYSQVQRSCCVLYQTLFLKSYHFGCLCTCKLVSTAAETWQDSDSSGTSVKTLSSSQASDAECEAIAKANAMTTTPKNNNDNITDDCEAPEREEENECPTKDPKVMLKAAVTAWDHIQASNLPDGPAKMPGLFKWPTHNADTLMNNDAALHNFEDLANSDVELDSDYSGMATAEISFVQQYNACLSKISLILTNLDV